MSIGTIIPSSVMGTPDGWDCICTFVLYPQILTYIAAIYTRQSSNHSRLNRIAYCPQVLRTPYSEVRRSHIQQLMPRHKKRGEITGPSWLSQQSRQSPQQPKHRLNRHTQQVASFISEIPNYQRYLMLGKRPRNSKALSKQQLSHTLTRRFVFAPTRWIVYPNQQHLRFAGKRRGVASHRWPGDRQGASLEKPQHRCLPRGILVALTGKILVGGAWSPLGHCAPAELFGQNKKKNGFIHLIQLCSTPPRRELAVHFQ